MAMLKIIRNFSRSIGDITMPNFKTSDMINKFHERVLADNSF